MKIEIGDILQFFIWNSMPTELQEQFLHINNKSKPTVADIEDKIFDAFERYKAFKKLETATYKPLSGIAASVKLKDTKTAAQSPSESFRKCILCLGDGNPVDHAVSKCDRYREPKDKLERLKQLKLCTRCLGKGHYTSKCNFRFRRPCYHCNKPNHFSFLCFKGSKEFDILDSNLQTKSIVTMGCQAQKFQ